MTPAILLIFLLIFFLIFDILPASAEEVLLETQQAFSLDNNTTLVIEDTNSPQAVICLSFTAETKPSVRQ